MDWQHKPECTDRECYCADPDEADPICECGRPGWACCYVEENDEQTNGH